jgi:hypothetical protein
MALLGQASGGWTESSSALRILYVGHRNSIGILTDDSFTQTNPPITTAGSSSADGMDTAVFGVLSGSVAIARPDQGSNYVGGPGDNTIIAASGGGSASTDGASSLDECYRPLGLFINDAAGNAFENQPGVASGKGPYVSSQGSYASSLYETANITGGAVGGIGAGDDITYITGVPLIASLNGYLMPAAAWDGAAKQSLDLATFALESAVQNAGGSSTTIGILKMPADATQPELVFDQRI